MIYEHLIDLAPGIVTADSTAAFPGLISGTILSGDNDLRNNAFTTWMHANTFNSTQTPSTFWHYPSKKSSDHFEFQTKECINFNCKHLWEGNKTFLFFFFRSIDIINHLNYDFLNYSLESRSREQIHLAHFLSISKTKGIHLKM